MKITVICILIVILLGQAASAELSVANIFSDNMVLQQGKPLRVWGAAAAGAKVDVMLGKISRSVSVGSDGAWQVELAPMKASFDPIELSAKSGVYHTAPIYREMKTDGDKALLYFDYDPIIKDRRAGKWYKRLPLSDRAREYRGFLIAGSDRRFFPAKVKVRSVKDDKDIAKECLEVWSPDVPKPAAVRYAWACQPNANAYGLCGLPVAPFRTDDWAFIRAEANWMPDLEKRKADNEKTRKQSEQWRRDRRIRELMRELESLGVKLPAAPLDAGRY